MRQHPDARDSIQGRLKQDTQPLPHRHEGDAPAPLLDPLRLAQCASQRLDRHRATQARLRQRLLLAR